MPEMDEGAFVLDYKMPVGTSLAQTDKVMRRVEAVLRDTATSPATSAAPGPRIGIVRHRIVHRRHSGEPQAAGPAAGDEARFESLGEDIKAKCRSWKLELVPLIQDQINDLAGVEAPIEVKVFGPDVAVLRDLAEKVAAVVEEAGGRRQRARVAGQSGHRRSSRQRRRPRGSA